VGRAVRLATFNVQHGQRPGGVVDVGLLARSCAALGADVLGLQEVDVNLRRSNDADTAAEVAAECGMVFVFGEAIAIRGGRYGNALLVRGAIDDVEVVALPDTEPRAAIVARVVPDGGPALSVCVTHLGLAGAFIRVESGPTWPAKTPRRTIDHVLLDGLIPTAAVAPAVPISDHRPLVVEVEVGLRSP
jgi:endonuclease/exonuclease/phosphatase family metal-dependent hydrolase